MGTVGIAMVFWCEAATGWCVSTIQRKEKALSVTSPSSTGRRNELNELKEATRNADATRAALAMAGLVADEVVICPECRRDAPRGKFKIHPDGGWNHFSSGMCYGDAISVLQAIDVPYVDAVRALNGLPTNTKLDRPENLDDFASKFVGRKSRVDPEILNGILWYGRKTGGVEAAQEFYGQWHIAPEVVEQWGAVYITDPKHFEHNVIKRFGTDALVHAGVFTETERGLYCLISDRHPVVEPHRHPSTGDVTFVQLRGSNEQLERYRQHKQDPKTYPYRGRSRFASLKGAPRAAQIGAGLHIIDKLPPGEVVYIVEGFKDGLAMASLGGYAYGIPGADYKPAEKICQLLSRHTVLVALDGDQAGREARDGIVTRDDAGNEKVVKEGLVSYLRRYGVDAHPKDIGPVPDLGMDVADYLVAGYASGKLNQGVACKCPACGDLRGKFPHVFT